jgi:hypothetical protein
LNLLIWSRNKPGNLSLSLKHAQRLHRSCSTSIGLQTLAETNRNKVGYVSTNSLLEEQKSVSFDCSVTLPLCLCVYVLGFLSLKRWLSVDHWLVTNGRRELRSFLGELPAIPSSAFRALEAQCQLAGAGSPMSKQYEAMKQCVMQCLLRLFENSVILVMFKCVLE